MLRRQNLGTLVALACLAEVLTFVAVVDWIGVGPALLIGLGSTLLGLARLRRVSNAAFAHLRSMAGRRGAPEDAFVDGAFDTAAAVLLVLPGFLTDLAGLALLAPSGRDWVKNRMGFPVGPLAGPRTERVRAAQGPRTIDLDTGDWSRLDRSRPS